MERLEGQHRTVELAQDAVERAQVGTEVPANVVERLRALGACEQRVRWSVADERGAHALELAEVVDWLRFNLPCTFNPYVDADERRQQQAEVVRRCPQVLQNLGYGLRRAAQCLTKLDVGRLAPS